MSDLSATVHNLESLLAGKSSFSQFMGDEGALITANIHSLDAALQPAVTIMWDSLKDGVSTLVGAGLSGIGPILAESSDVQATQLLNILSAMGVPTKPPLSIAEQAALVTAINGLKAFLDRLGIHISTAGVVTT